MNDSERLRNMGPHVSDPRDIASPPGLAAPRGRGSVFSPQDSGFWQLEKGQLHPSLPLEDCCRIRVDTFEPWIGCLYGRACEFCYVPEINRRHGWSRDSFWYGNFGKWLIFKPGLEAKVRTQLMRTRPDQWKLIFGASKTEILTPLKSCREVLHFVLDALAAAPGNVYFMLQTRRDPTREGLYPQILALAERGRLGVSMSLSSDLASPVEHAILTPDERLRIMRRLKEDGVFVSCAVAPIAPFSSEFARKLVQAAHHVAVQEAKPPGRSGAATRKPAFERLVAHSEANGFGPGQLAQQLVDDLTKADPDFPWGIDSAGFVGAFASALRHYGRWDAFLASIRS